MIYKEMHEELEEIKEILHTEFKSRFMKELADIVNDFDTIHCMVQGNAGFINSVMKNDKLVKLATTLESVVTAMVEVGQLISLEKRDVPKQVDETAHYRSSY
jgi:hypothetical protein